MPLYDLIQRDPFGEKLITITAENLNQTQITNFLNRMHEYETPGNLEKINSQSNQYLDYKLPDSDEEGGKKATTKEPWDPDNGENIIDANDYEKPSNSKSSKTEEKKEEKSEKPAESSKNKRPKRQTKKEEEEEVISAYNASSILYS